MYWFSTTMGVLAAVLHIYMILLIIRVLLTWVSMDHGQPVIRILTSITDPYLNWFRRFRFLTLGSVDFSPLAALLVVNFLANIAEMVGSYGQISIGIILAVLVQLVWGIVSFFLFLIGILAVVRLLAIRFRWGSPLLWNYLDNVLQPLAATLGRVLRPKTFMAYTSTLLILGISSLVLALAGNWSISRLAMVLVNLPL